MPDRAEAVVAVPSLRERKYLRMRQAIIEEATRLFETKGYSNTTLKDVADAAETSVATIMRYFASKDAILLDRERAIVSGLAERVRERRYPTLSEGVRDIAWRSGVELKERERLHQIILADPNCVPLTAVLRREWEGLLEELYLMFSPKTWEGRLRAKSLAMMQTAIGIAGSQFWHDEGPEGRPYPMQSELVDEFINSLVKPIDQGYAALRKAERTRQSSGEGQLAASSSPRRRKRAAAPNEET
jgi:AcrR family transcriptional regulator